jgi:DNA-directed DNA polymerase III PolC
MLNCHSFFSLKYGVVDPQDLAFFSKELGFKNIALTDINNTSGVLNFVRYSQETGQTPVVGVDFRNGIDCRYVALAKNNEGFNEINMHLTEHNKTEKPFPATAPAFNHCIVIYPWGKEPEILRENEFIGVAAYQLNRFRLHKSTHPEKYVALQSMTFLHKRDFNTHRLLRAIDNNLLLSRLPESEQSRADAVYMHAVAFEQLYRDFPDLVKRSEELLDHCGISFNFNKSNNSQNIAHFSNSEEDDLILVTGLCEKAIEKRYGNVQDKSVIRERIQREINVINQKKYLSYFLVAWDIVSYARSKGYYYVGRGSGANSVVAYLLEITDVDPLELDLYFERFINLYRENPPDFDMDFSWRDRDDVMRYIFERYPDKSALVCTYSTFQMKATIRELGKVFGLPATDIEGLAKSDRPLDANDQMQKLVLKYSKLISGLPSHLSVHAGGIVVSQKPITWFSATFPTSKKLPTTQFSMIEAEDVGLYKFDILSQRGLGKIKDTLDIIAYNQPENPPHDIHDVKTFIHDPKINKLLSEAKAIGCFYVESPAMRMLMIKLKTDNYLGLVAASSIIRPGVASSGMMREYILRHRDPERINQAHPILLGIMPETYGVMVYQEDVIKVGSAYGKLSAAEADILRRGMGGKFKGREEFLRVRDQFFENCRKAQYPEKEIRDIWFQMESFAGYAFSKGHSASYAVESYQCLYLKTYYPLEYMVATINNYGGFYGTEVYVREAQKLGATVEAPCINRSYSEAVIYDKLIILGLQLVGELEGSSIQKIVSDREENGPFTGLIDLMERTLISLEQVSLLIRIGALRSFGISKKELLWRAHLHCNKTKVKTMHPRLFVEEQRTFQLPQLDEVDVEISLDQQLLLGFTLCNPFDLLKEPINNEIKADNLHLYVGQMVTVYGYKVVVKKVVSAKGHHVHFGTLLDSDGEQLDTVHFQDAVFRSPYNGSGIFEVKGKVACEFDHYTIEVESVKRLMYVDDPRLDD